MQLLEDPAPRAQTFVPERKKMTLHRLLAMHAAGERIAMLTCYDATMAKLFDVAAVDVLLVGDSLGQLVQGHESTLPVSIEQMAYHTRCVARGNELAWLIADMPFGTYQESSEQAFRNAALLVQSGAKMVKVEGGGWTADTVKFLVDRGIPVCGHLGLTPQSVHALGGYRVQGRGEAEAAQLLCDAHELADAGASMLVLEMVPKILAEQVVDALPIPVIGIGAAPSCAGQVLVWQDMLGISRGKLPRFFRNFMQEGGSVEDAVRRYVMAVKDGSFPQDGLHTY